MHAASSVPTDIVSEKIRDNDTYNTCTYCGKEWRDAVPTPNVLHRYRLCEFCLRRGMVTEVQS